MYNNKYNIIYYICILGLTQQLDTLAAHFGRQYGAHLALATLDLLGGSSTLLTFRSVQETPIFPGEIPYKWRF